MLHSAGRLVLKEVHGVLLSLKLHDRHFRHVDGDIQH